MSTSTHSTVIKGILQKLKSKKKLKFAFIGNTAVKSTIKQQHFVMIPSSSEAF